MNTLLKGIIVAIATIFGFALIAAGVSIAASPSTDTSEVAKRDNVVAKRDDDSAPVLAVAQDDDDGVGDDNGGQTRTRTGHRGSDDHGNSGPGGGDDHSRDFSRDLTNTN